MGGSGEGRREAGREGANLQVCKREDGTELEGKKKKRENGKKDGGKGGTGRAKMSKCIYNSHFHLLCSNVYLFNYPFYKYVLNTSYVTELNAQMTH